MAVGKARKLGTRGKEKPFQLPRLTEGRVPISDGRGNVALLKKLDRKNPAWALSLGPRTRFGDANDIRQDIKFFMDNGRLPPRHEGSWA